MSYRPTDADRNLATDVAYVAGLGITANAGTLTPVNGGAIRPTPDVDTIELTLTIPDLRGTELHDREVAAAIEAVRAEGATVVDRATLGTAATTITVQVSRRTRAAWTAAASRPTASFAR